ncbi:hypothetical protein CHARACLAT_010794 [Characodon lateralis]|uniref:Immunoglobulin V-set domain-containing protein n=1 Tax=Characodon lateralis TaxID=208331 RepID=A0ABU7DRT9_9TELE|nr:hypothetical protein [Characodon lateralis]
MIEIVADGCNASGQTDETIRCGYPNHYQSKIKLVCSNKEFTCEKVSTQTSQDSNWESRHKMPSVNAVFSRCKIKEKETKKDNDRLTLRVTDITTFTKSPTIGENFTYFCKYNVEFKNPDIFICKGEDPTDCQVVLNTKTALENLRFTRKNNKSNVTITVRKVTASDSGTYWCGADNPDKNNRIFMHRFFLNVVPAPTSAALSTTSSSVFVTTSMSPSPITAAATGGLRLGVMTSIIIGAFGLMLLLLVIVTFSLYKRCVCSEEAQDRSSEQHPKEECIYEVIPDGQQTTVTSVYATVNFPTNDPASLYYSAISFQTSSTENIDGEALVLKPSTSSCQYSVLKYSQSSTALTDPPTRSTDEPLYSAVKKPR